MRDAKRQTTKGDSGCTCSAHVAMGLPGMRSIQSRGRIYGVERGGQKRSGKRKVRKVRGGSRAKSLNYLFRDVT